MICYRNPLARTSFFRSLGTTPILKKGHSRSNSRNSGVFPSNSRNCTQDVSYVKTLLSEQFSEHTAGTFTGNPVNVGDLRWKSRKCEAWRYWGTDSYPVRVLGGVVLALRGCQTPAQYWKQSFTHGSRNFIQYWRWGLEKGSYGIFRLLQFCTG